MAAEAALAGKSLPLDRGTRALQNTEDAVFFPEDSLYSGSCKNKERMKFAEVQQAHNGVHIGRRQEDAGDWRMIYVVCIGTQVRSDDDLRSQIGAGRCQEPNAASGVRREGDLCLRASVPAKRSGTQVLAVVASAIPLREAASGCRAKNFNAHEDTKIGWVLGIAETK